MVCLTGRREHITPVLQELHWLPVLLLCLCHTSLYISPLPGVLFFSCVCIIPHSTSLHFQVFSSSPVFVSYLTLHLSTSRCSLLLLCLCHTSLYISPLPGVLFSCVCVIPHSTSLHFQVFSSSPVFVSYLTLHLSTSRCSLLLLCLCHTSLYISPLSGVLFFSCVCVIPHSTSLHFQVFSSSPVFVSYLTPHLSTFRCSLLLLCLCYTSLHISPLPGVLFFSCVCVIPHSTSLHFQVFSSSPVFVSYLTPHLSTFRCSLLLLCLYHTSLYISPLSGVLFFSCVCVIPHSTSLHFQVFSSSPVFVSYLTPHLSTSRCSLLLLCLCHTSLHISPLPGVLFSCVCVIPHSTSLHFQVFSSSVFVSYLTPHLSTSRCSLLLLCLCHTSLYISPLPGVLFFSCVCVIPHSTSLHFQVFSSPVFVSYLTPHLSTSMCSLLLLCLCHTSLHISPLPGVLFSCVCVIPHSTSLHFQVFSSPPVFVSYLTLHLSTSRCSLLLLCLCHTSFHISPLPGVLFSCVCVIPHSTSLHFQVFSSPPVFVSYLTPHLSTSRCSLLLCLCHTSFHISPLPGVLFSCVCVIPHSTSLHFQVFSSPVFVSYLTPHLSTSRCSLLLLCLCHTSLHISPLPGVLFSCVCVIPHSTSLHFQVFSSPVFVSYLTPHLSTSRCSLLLCLCHTSFHISPLPGVLFSCVCVIPHSTSFHFQVFSSSPVFVSYLTPHLSTSRCSLLLCLCHTSLYISPLPGVLFSCVCVIPHSTSLHFQVFSSPVFVSYLTPHLSTSRCSLLLCLCHTSLHISPLPGVLFSCVCVIPHSTSLHFQVFSSPPVFVSYLTPHLSTFRCHVLLLPGQPDPCGPSQSCRPVHHGVWRSAWGHRLLPGRPAQG